MLSTSSYVIHWDYSFEDGGLQMFPIPNIFFSWYFPRAIRLPINIRECWCWYFFFYCVVEIIYSSFSLFPGMDYWQGGHLPLKTRHGGDRTIVRLPGFGDGLPSNAKGVSRNYAMLRGVFLAIVLTVEDNFGYCQHHYQKWFCQPSTQRPGPTSPSTRNTLYPPLWIFTFTE